MARRRCMQERVATEAARFLDVLCRILRRSPKVALEEVVSEEVRTGAFAAAGQSEIKAVFNVWRRTLESFALEVGSAFKWDKLIRGANGSRAVRAGGGVVMVQRPSTAIFPSMPESAIATGAVEFIVSRPFLGDAVEVLVRQGRSALAALSTKEARPHGR